MTYLIDKLYTGLFLGIIAPFILLLAYYFYGFSTQLTFFKYIKFLLASQIFTQIASICVIINLLLFFIFIWTYNNYAARGVLMATIIYALVIAFATFVL
jgi:hypothetical protein